MPRRHLPGKRRLRGPDASDDEHGYGAQIPPKRRSTRGIVGPAHDRNGEADDQRQPEVDAKRRARRFLTMTFAALDIALLANLGGAWFWWKTVEFTFDLPQLDRPIDLTQRSLPAEGFGKSLRFSTDLELGPQRVGRGEKSVR